MAEKERLRTPASGSATQRHIGNDDSTVASFKSNGGQSHQGSCQSFAAHRKSEKAPTGRDKTP